MSKAATKTGVKKATGPSYELMIKEAILAHPEEARGGLSRPLIKKYLHKKHPETSKMSEASFNNHISKAIAKGAEKKTFVLPKGPSGKVKLAPSAKKAPAAKKAPVKKAATATKKPAAKKTTTTTAAAKKPAAKKATTTTKKPAAKKTAAAKPKKTTSSTTTKAKKPAAKKTAAKAVTKKKAAPKKA